MERKLTRHTDCVSVVSTRNIRQVCKIPGKPVTWGNKFYILARNIFKHNYRSFPNAKVSITSHAQNAKG